MMSGNKDRKIFEEIMTEDFSNLLKNINLHISEAQWMPSRISTKTYNNQIFERQQRESWKQKGKKAITLKGTPVRFLADISSESMQTRRQWDDIFKVQKEKKIINK